jgi:hypothetical protein
VLHIRAMALGASACARYSASPARSDHALARRYRRRQSLVCAVSARLQQVRGAWFYSLVLRSLRRFAATRAAPRVANGAAHRGMGPGPSGRAQIGRGSNAIGGVGFGGASLTGLRWLGFGVVVGPTEGMVELQQPWLAEPQSAPPAFAYRAPQTSPALLFPLWVTPLSIAMSRSGGLKTPGRSPGGSVASAISSRVIGSASR